jgi:group I intron endonuclease
MIGIYKITSPSGKIYIGQSGNLEKRLKDYLGEYKSVSSQTRLYNSFKKYGAKNHIFEIIEECILDEINIRERFWQDYYDVISVNGLNCILTQTDVKKRIVSEETRKKMSNSLKGKYVGNLNPMFGRYGNLNPFYGKKHSEETKKILKEKNSGVNNVFYGKKRPEHSIKISGKNHPFYGKKSIRTSEMNSKRIGLLNPVAKIYLDLNTGVFYYSANDYCKIHNLNSSTFRYKFRTKKLNNLIVTF